MSPPLCSAAELILGCNMALYSAAAYPDGPSIATPDRKVTVLVQGQFRAIVVEDVDSLTISVAGTDSIRNDITDIRCVQEPIMEGAVTILCHVGFREGLYALWPLVLAFLETNRKTLYLTGHSLGAAIVRLILIRMFLEMGMRPAAIVTFGEPRSLNYFGARFCERLGVKSCRWIDEMDIVARVPWFTIWPPEKVQLFRHPEGSYWIVDGQVDVNRSAIKRIPQDWRGYLAERQARGPARELFPLVQDHFISRYRERLASIVLPTSP